MQRILHLTVIGVAAWTLICNLVVFNQGNLRHLGGVLVISLLIGIFCLVWQRRLLFPAPQTLREKHPDALNVVVWCLALGIALTLTLTLNRPDADDAFYVNMAVGAVDHPSENLLCRDTMHHLTGAPILLPFYKIHSIELLAALSAWVTGLPAIFFLHIVFPPVTALLALLAYRMLFMRLAPQFWGYASLATCLFLCANGDVHASYAGTLLVLLAVLPLHRIIDAGNHVRIGKPGLKVPLIYGVVQAVAANLKPGDSVLMPVELSPWLPTLHHAARPVLSRSAYAYLYASDKRATVRAAQAFISGNGARSDDGGAFATLIQCLDVKAVCFAEHLEHADFLADILERFGFKAKASPGTTPYVLYVRTGPHVQDHGTH